MIDRDTIIDLVALVDTEFEKLKVGTYNGFDVYERFALYVEAKVRKEEREACINLADSLGWVNVDAIRARGLQELNKAAEKNGEEL
jgi:hypothetical protein